MESSKSQRALSPLISQRWFHGRSNFRLSREPINPAEFGVDRVARELAKAFVCQHHYSGSFPPEIASFGLYRKSDASAARLVGVAVFSPASNINSVSRWTGLQFDQGAELARLILLDEVAGNGESWFLTRALALFKAGRPKVKVVLSYSDPVPRTRYDGSIIFPGHYGCCYSAINALYLGRASPKRQFLSADGAVVANRIFSKLRNGETGRAYAERALSEVSGLVRGPEEPPSDFLDRVLATMRVQSHPGNHLYLFPTAQDRREKSEILSLPVLQSRVLSIRSYPKRPDPVAIGEIYAGPRSAAVGLG
jgi:hypothetical protein